MAYPPALIKPNKMCTYGKGFKRSSQRRLHSQLCYTQCLQSYLIQREETPSCVLLNAHKALSCTQSHLLLSDLEARAAVFSNKNKILSEYLSAKYFSGDSRVSCKSF